MPVPLSTTTQSSISVANSSYNKYTKPSQKYTKYIPNLYL